jgi:hypothetical protein
LGDKPNIQYLLSSREPERLSASQWLADQRGYWNLLQWLSYPKKQFHAQQSADNRKPPF